MPTPTPTLAVVAAAIKAAMELVPGSHTVRTGFETFEDQVEFVERGGFISSGTMALWFVEVESVDEIEGDSPGETYSVYNFRLRYWSLMTSNANWSRDARELAETIRDGLSGKASVFSIGSQRQLRTPETVTVTSHGPATIRGSEGEQMIYETMLRLSVEARRWT